MSVYVCYFFYPVLLINYLLDKSKIALSSYLFFEEKVVHIASNQYMLYNIRSIRYNRYFAQGFQRTCQTTTHIHKNSVTKNFVEHTTIFSLVKFSITHTCIAFSIHTVSNKRVLLWFHSLLLNK